MSATPVREMALTPKDEAQSIALTPADRMAQTVQALATNPDVDVDKLERIIKLQQDMLAEEARQAFNAAMTAAQREMGPIVARGWNPETKSKYRKYEDIDLVIRPIYTAHGFAMSFNTKDSPKEDEIRVLCLVSHAAGHEREYLVDVPSDGKGIKGGVFMTRTHATGSGLTYGKRYLADLIWNLAMTKDDDGNQAGRVADVQAPKGFEPWFADLEAVADEGHDTLKAAWEASKPAFRRHLTQTNSRGWEALKRRAAEVSAKAKEQA